MPVEDFDSPAIVLRADETIPEGRFAEQILLFRRKKRALLKHLPWTRTHRNERARLNRFILRNDIATVDPESGKTASVIAQGLLENFPIDSSVKDIEFMLVRLWRLGDVKLAVKLFTALSPKRQNGIKRNNHIRRLTEANEVLQSGITFLDRPDHKNYEPIPGRVAYILHNSLPFQSGGYATRSHGVMSGIASHGYEVFGITRPGFPHDLGILPEEGVAVPAPLQIESVHYHRLPEVSVPRHTYLSYAREWADLLEQWCLEFRPEIIHAASFGLNGIVATEVARRLNIRAVFEVRGLHELRDESFTQYRLGSDQDALVRGIETQAVVQADWVFGITGALIERSVKRGAQASRTSLLPNGVNVENFSQMPRDVELTEKLGLSDKTIIGYVGSVLDYEGLDLLVDAAEELQKTRTDFQVVIVGSGPHTPELEKHIANSPARELITLVGRVAHSEVNSYYSIMDICPLPRLPLPICEEVSPLKPFEAMAMGRCLVMSSVSAMAEIIGTEDIGVIFEKGNVGDLARVLAELIDSPDTRDRLGRNARAWVVENRNWPAITAEVARVYREFGVLACPA
ncbi:MAG: glycosyltransferase [Actinobacteria bacterium]|nr:glycosyltransferase [Actinomycetota bacterium]NBY15566.1 glycosyltransferase [Actinomycetota bacterium]